jgi:hypothetical protein
VLWVCALSTPAVIHETFSALFARCDQTVGSRVHLLVIPFIQIDLLAIVKFVTPKSEHHPAKPDYRSLKKQEKCISSHHNNQIKSLLPFSR